MKKIFTVSRLLLTFYKSFLLASALITACCIFVFTKNGMKSFAAIFWFKIFSDVVIFYLVNEFKQNEYYYYYNFGISKKVLWFIVLGIDFLIFLFLLFQLYRLL